MGRRPWTVESTVHGLRSSVVIIKGKTMQSKGLFGKKGLQIEERQQDIGAPGPNHVIVKVRACGVCGTDINFVRDWPDQPMALGHELAGEVVEIGKEVTHIKPGDRVIVE